jgi:2-keto-3-deoxy-L-rhamnonate aldolase RhmA
MADELRDILRNRVKEKLARDEVVASMTVRLSRTIEIARIAATAGFDTLYVDVEHNTFSIDSVCQTRRKIRPNREPGLSRLEPPSRRNWRACGRAS